MMRFRHCTWHLILLLAAGCAASPAVPEHGKGPEEIPPMAAALTSPAESPATLSSVPQQPAAPVKPATAESVIPLRWVEAPSPAPLPPARTSDLQHGVAMVRELTLEGLGAAVYLYEHPEDKDHVYGVLSLKDGMAAELGPVAGSVYLEGVEADSLTLFGKRMIRIRGAVGAAAAVTRYIAWDEGQPPKLELLVEEGHAAELDVDGDGKREVIASGGTNPAIVLYKQNVDGAVLRAELNEPLKADSVTVTEEGVFEAMSVSSPDVRLYRLASEGLRLTAAYDKETYLSNRTSRR
ncbi:hypothetical protein ACFFK0_22290 [Paenibacillus chartarius]|uniref:VCBS repeat-containing protein n=1 Tax=Paenibacillus chartarius TaxID=747481 RepID=A0ABV6DR54_9BACL